jgi:hypothetical protein
MLNEVKSFHNLQFLANLAIRRLNDVQVLINLAKSSGQTHPTC